MPACSGTHLHDTGALLWVQAGFDCLMQAGHIQEVGGTTGAEHRPNVLVASGTGVALQAQQQRCFAASQKLEQCPPERQTRQQPAACHTELATAFLAGLAAAQSLAVRSRDFGQAAALLDRSLRSAAALQTVGKTICSALQYRWNTYKSLRERIDKDEGGLEKFTQGGKQHGRR